MTNETIKEELQNLVDRYEENKEQYEQTTYNETEVRNDFLNPFFELLGWDVLNTQKLSQGLREVKLESNVEVEEGEGIRKKKPDYEFRFARERKFFLEAKKPQVNILKDSKPAFQVKRYGWSAKLKISVLSNFKDIIIYDCTMQPNEKDAINKGIIAQYNYKEYVEKFDEIYKLLSKESVINGEFDTLYDSIEVSYTRKPFDDHFLEQIRKWRESLTIDIINNNQGITSIDINRFIQCFINRIIFLRICEDKQIEKYNVLKEINTYDQLKKLFGESDKKYNSGLFELIEGHELNISDEIIIRIFADLYYPNSIYAFEVIEPHILGAIYEMFLKEEVQVDSDKGFTIEKKEKMVDSQGVVTTPKYIVDTMVEQLMDKLLDKKSIEQIGALKIADICCGSGMFLLGVYDYLVEYYTKYYMKKYNINEGYIEEKELFLQPNQAITLSIEEKKNILLNNIFGVDIDPLAVEVAKFSLVLKMIEDSSPQEVEEYIKTYKCAILPNLDCNIRCGNSLVGMDYLELDDLSQEAEVISKINPFDWESEFFSQLCIDGFDAIIGNPPYIRTQNIIKYLNEEYQYIKHDSANYVTAKTELLDEYLLFIEKATKLLKEDGKLLYLVPNKFLSLQNGKCLRKYISENKYLSNLSNFYSNQIIPKRSTYLCVLELTKKENKEFAFKDIENVYLWRAGEEIKEKVYPIEYITEEPWIFWSEDNEEKLKNLDKTCKPLESFCDIYVGLQTSNDNIYIISPNTQDENYVYFTDYNGVDRKVERGILRPCIYDAQIEQFVDIDPNAYIVFPYKEMNGRTAILYTVEEMESDFPECYSYLKEYKEVLLERSIQNITDENWFKYGRSQSIGRFLNEKESLIWPVLSLKANYVYDEGTTLFTGGGNGPYYGLRMKNNCELKIEYIQAMLSYSFIEGLVKEKATTFRGAYYSHGKQFIKGLPIKDIDFSNQREVDLYNNIVNLMGQIKDINNKISNSKNKHDKNIQERIFEAKKIALDKDIQELYGI